MTKRKKQLNLVTNLLTKELDRLRNEIKEGGGGSKGSIELKEQITDAIANLELCANHNIYAQDISIIEIPEGGSESHFTEFYIVDERGTDNTPEWTIKKDKKGLIKLSCFDLIIRK